MVRERLEVGDEARFVVLHESEGLLVRPDIPSRVDVMTTP
jgi:hypothetical protein